MYTVTIKVRCSDTTSEASDHQTDLRLDIESIVSVALLELFSAVEVKGIVIENDEHACPESIDHFHRSE